jgi:hypothetical protein
LGARDVVLSAGSTTFPASDIAVRIDNRGARLAPLRITLTPRLVAEVEGTLDRSAAPARYELTFSCGSVSLRDAARVSRTLGFRSLPGWSALGSATASLRVSGVARLSSPPALAGHAEVRDAHIMIPGFTEPLNVPRASLQVNGNAIVIDPLVAALGTSVFSGRLERQGGSHSPWAFDLHSNRLDLAQGAAWFAALGRRRSVPLLERLPGLGTPGGERQLASNLFSALNAQGKLAAAGIAYQGIALDNFHTDLEIADRVIRISNAAFRTSGGDGRLSGQADLSLGKPTHLAGEAVLTAISLQPLAAHLPPALHGAHGSISLRGHFETTGLSRLEMLDNLEAEASVTATNLTLAGFDPVAALVRSTGEGTLEPLRAPVGLHSLKLEFQLQKRVVTLSKTSVDLGGARLSFDGSEALGGAASVHVSADLRHLRRRWLTRDDDASASAESRELGLAGPLDKLEPVVK